MDREEIKRNALAIFGATLWSATKDGFQWLAADARRLLVAGLAISLAGNLLVVWFVLRSSRSTADATTPKLPITSDTDAAVQRFEKLLRERDAEWARRQETVAAESDAKWEKRLAEQVRATEIANAREVTAKNGLKALSGELRKVQEELERMRTIVRLEKVKNRVAYPQRVFDAIILEYQHDSALRAIALCGYTSALIRNGGADSATYGDAHKVQTFSRHLEILRAEGSVGNGAPAVNEAAFLYGEKLFESARSAKEVKP